jgi:hypothetical protein
LSEGYSEGGQSTNHYTTQAEGVFKFFNKKLNLQVMVPYTFVGGALPTNSGFGNFSVGLLPTIYKNEKIFVFGNVAVHFPIGNTSEMYDDSIVYPNPYQTAHNHVTLSFALNLNEIKSNWHFGVSYEHLFHPGLDSTVLQPRKKDVPDTFSVTQSSNALSLKVEKYFYVKNWRFDATASPNLHFQTTKLVDSSAKLISSSNSGFLNLSLNGAVHYTFPSRNKSQSNSIFFALGISAVNNINSWQTFVQSWAFTLGYRHSFF